jgi:putative peptidoglycan lipid II flippase
MPAVAESVAARDVGATKRHLQRAIYLLILVSLPLSVWLGLVNRPLIAFLYQRASFSVSDTLLVSNLLLFMIPYLFLSRFHGLLELPFFADQDTRTPLIANAAAALVYVAGSLLLVSHLGIYAMPIGRMLSSLSGPCLLGYLLRRRIGSLGLTSVRRSAWKVCIASAIMATFIALGVKLVGALSMQGSGTKIVALGLPTSAVFFAILVSLFALGIMDSSVLDVYLPRHRQWLARLGPLADYPRRLLSRRPA